MVKTLNEKRYMLENLIKSHLRLDDPKLAIAIWFKREDDSKLHLFEGMDSFLHNPDIPQLPPQKFLHTRDGGGWFSDIPLRHIIVYSPKATMEKLIIDDNPLIREMLCDYEILYFNPDLLSPIILKTYNILVKPDNLIKGWYLRDEDIQDKPKLNQMSTYRHTIGIMQTSESLDFIKKIGIMHIEVNNQWVPSSKKGVKSYTWYEDWIQGNPGYFLLEGGKLFKIEGFEIKTLPKISKKVIKPDIADEYVEVYLTKLSMDSKL